MQNSVIHVTSCFYYFSLRKGTIAFAIFFLVNHIVWLTLNIGKFITPEGLHLLKGMEHQYTCIRESLRNNKLDGDIKLPLLEVTNNESDIDEERVKNTSVTRYKRTEGNYATSRAVKRNMVSMKHLSGKVTDCRSKDGIQEAWQWSAAATHIICSILAIIFNSFLIYGAVKMKQSVVCTCTVYSFTYWLYLLLSLSVTLTLKAIDRFTSNTELFISFLLSLGFLSFLLYAIVVMNSFRIKMKRDKRMWYSPSSTDTEIYEDRKEDSST